MKCNFQKKYLCMHLQSYIPQDHRTQLGLYFYFSSGLLICICISKWSFPFPSSRLLPLPCMNGSAFLPQGPGYVIVGLEYRCFRHRTSLFSQIIQEVIYLIHSAGQLQQPISRVFSGLSHTVTCIYSNESFEL